MFCKMNGMKLATVTTTNDEFKNFKTIVANHSDLPDSIFIDAATNFESGAAPEFFLFEKLSIKQPIRKVASTIKAPFLCEDIEEADNFVHRSEKSKFSSREKFFKYLGDYSEFDLLRINLVNFYLI